MKKLLPYILILIIILGFTLPTTRVSAIPEGCYNKTNGLPVALDRATCEDNFHKEQGFYWWPVQVCTKPETLSEQNECVCKLPNVRENNKCITPDVTTPPSTTTEPLGTCLPQLADNETGPPQPIKNITEKDCKDKGGKWTASSTYVFLAPLPCEEGIPGCVGGQLTTFDPVEKNNIGIYLNIMLRIFIGICAVLAVIMIVVGGIEYMTSELPGNKEGGKDRITGAIFGLVLALGAYTLLYQINPDLLKTDLASLTDQTVLVDLQDSVQQPQPENGKKYPNSNYRFGDPWDDSIGIVQNIPGTTKNYPECKTVGQSSGCLSTRNLDRSALVAVKNKCPSAQIILTGGTEFWHHGGQSGNTSHGPGSSTVDIATNPALDACLSGGKPLVKFSRYPESGGPYYYEGNHWHIGR